MARQWCAIRWAQWVRDQITTATRAAAIAVSEAVAEQLDDLEDALEKRDKRIEKLELANLGVEVSRMRVAQAQADVDRDREHSSASYLPPVRRDLN